MTELLLGGIVTLLTISNCYIVYRIVRFYTKRNAALQDVIRNADDDYYMCGDSIASHSFGSGHAPVGMLSYYTHQIYQMQID